MISGELKARDPLQLPAHLAYTGGGNTVAHVAQATASTQSDDINPGEKGCMTNFNWSIDGDEFTVIVNKEGQYSLWPSARDIPSGWKQVGPVGAKRECLDWIESVWTDMRPLSLND